MMNTNISFTEEKRGYDKNQVNSYIKKLSEAYQITYDEYMDVSGKYETLLEETKRSGEQENPKTNSEVITKVLVNAEVLAQTITADAQADAENIKNEAQKLIDEANKKVANARLIVQKIINEANAEAALAKETAQKIIDGANAEAAMIVVRARKSLDQTYKTMKLATNEFEKLINTPVLKAENVTAAG